MTEVSYILDFPTGKQNRTSLADVRSAEAAGPPVSRIARLMALAIRFDALLREGKFKDQTELAWLGGVTRARMTQIMQLLDLAPDIQEQILFLQLIEGLNERNLRPIVQSIDWRKQRRLFRKITGPLNRSGPRARKICEL